MRHTSQTDLIVLCGLSGSGKTVAARALEDVGYYCIDKLPACVLIPTLQALQAQGIKKMAIGLEMADPDFLRSAQSHWNELESQGFSVRVVLLTCRMEVLIRRYHETRRPHPLSSQNISTESAIQIEVCALRNVPRSAHVIDTSDITANMLIKRMQEFTNYAHSGLRIIIQSFGFKHGAPSDTDMLFDARFLPNPYYDPALRPWTGKDQNVKDFFEKYPEVDEFCTDIGQFLNRWAHQYEKDHRQCLSISVGCTGGQHRSVYLAEKLGRDVNTHNITVRHRDAHHWPANPT